MLRKRLAIFFLLVLTVILVPTPLTSIPRAKAFNRIDSLSLNNSLVLSVAQNFLTSAVIDTSAGYAYFGASPCYYLHCYSHQEIVKVRLSDFVRVSTLTLNFSEWDLTAAVIDTLHGYAYFGAPGNPGFIVKVSLSNFTVVDSVPIPDENLATAVIDPSGGYAYFGGTSAVYRLDLSNFTDMQTLNLNTCPRCSISSATIDPAGGFAYFGMWGVTDYNVRQDDSIVRVRLSDFTTDGNLTLNIGTIGTNLAELSSAVIDPAGGYAYFGGKNVTDAGGTIGVFVNGTIVRIRLSDFSESGALIPADGGENLGGAVIDSSAGYAYFGSQNYNAEFSNIIRIRLSDFSEQGVLSSNPPDLPSSSVIDPVSGFAYFGTDGVPGEVLKINLADFTKPGTLIFNSGENRLLSAAIDPAGGYAYFGGVGSGFHGSGVIVRVRLSNFSYAGNLTLSYGEGIVSAAAVDAAGGYAYFGTWNSTACCIYPGVIVRVRLSDFSRAGTINLNPGETYVKYAAIDAAGGYAYFGTTNATSSSVIVKVHLSDFSRTDTLSLDSVSTPCGSGGFLSGAVIDSAHGYGYFVRNYLIAPEGPISCQWGQYEAGVVKVRLSDFSVQGTLTLNRDGLLPPQTIVTIDPAGGYAYIAGTGTEYPGHTDGWVVKVQLSDMTTIANVTITESDGLIFDSGAIDPSGGYAYLGTDDAPGMVVKIRLSDLTETARLVLAPGENRLYSAILDAAQGFAYFGTGTDPGIVVKLQIWSSLNIPCSGHTCQVVSNSTLSGGTYAPNNLYFNASGSAGSNAFANATVPQSLVQDVNKVEVYQNGMLIPSTNIRIGSNNTYYSMYVSFTLHGTDGFRICMGPCSSVGIQPYVPLLATLLVAIFTLSPRRRPPPVYIIHRE